MNPMNTSLRSHHSLKNSIIMDNSNTSHLNPVSARLGLSKKTSAHYRDDSCSKNMEHIRFQNSQEHRAPANGLTPRCQAYGILDNKNKDYSRQKNLYTDRKLNQVFTKLQLLTLNYDRHQNRIKILQSAQLCQVERPLGVSREQINCILQRQEQGRQNKFQKTITDLQQKVNHVAFEIQNLYTRPEFQKKVENCVMSLKKNWLKSSADIQSKINENIQVIVEKFYKSYNQILDKFQEKWQNSRSEWKKFQQQVDLNIQKVFLTHTPNTNNKQQPKNKQIISKMEPLFNKPNFRLKFLGVVTMMGLHDDNPEQEIEVESQIMVYKVDCEGYLLDERDRYILDSQGRQIRLSEAQIRSLQEHKMFR